AWEGVNSASRALRWKFTRSASSPSSLSQGGHSPRGRNSWPKGGGRPSWSAPTAIRPYTRGNQPRKSRSSHWRATCIERCPRGSDRGPLEKDPPSGGHLASGLPVFYDPAFLVTAWERVYASKGARTAGIDKATVAMVETSIGAGAFLSQIRDSLKTGEFRPVEVRRVMIPKANGKLRRLGIPTIADRAVQESLKWVLEPIFEADFKPCSYGYRPNRRAQDAITEIHYFVSSPRNYQWVLECDIKACFDEISHTALTDRLRARIKDKRICALVKAFLKSGVLTELGDREETLTGTPQGGILSPLLANIALSALDEHFDRQWHSEMSTGPQRAKRRRNGQGNWRLVRYADDFVLMVFGDRHHAEALREEVSAVLAPLGLRLAPEKTRVVHVDEGFTFLGFDIRRMRKRGTSKYYVYTKPSRKAIASIKDKAKAKTYRSTLHMDLDELMRWRRAKYAGKTGLSMKELRRRFCDQGLSFDDKGVELTGASTVAEARYR